MSPVKKLWIIAIVSALGAWGCAQGPANGTASMERIRALETKISKLEEDFKGAIAVRDQLRKELTGVKEDRNRLGQQVEQLQAVVKERDELRQQLTVRTTERDTLQTQFEQFRKGIKTLLGQAEPTAAQPVTSAVEAPAPGKS